MRIFAALLFAILPLFASEPDYTVELKGGSMLLANTPNTPSDTARYSELSATYKNLNMMFTNSPFYKYGEVGYGGEYGVSGSAYSYCDGGTNGARVQYRYHDKTGGWSPFIGVSAQRSTKMYAGDQPLTSYGGTLGLVYTAAKSENFRLTCFREFRHAGIANTELAYEHVGTKYFGMVKIGMAFGNPERSNKTKRYLSGGFRLGTTINSHFAAYLYAERFHYADFLVYTQQNVGIGIRTTF